MKIMQKSVYPMVMGLLFTCALQIASVPFVNVYTCRPHVVKQRKKQFCYISFVEINGKRYLVKQKRLHRHLLGVVCDAFASYIAESLDKDLAQKVIIIPASKRFPGKKYQDWPATVHTIVEGSALKGKRGAYRKMNIKQAMDGFTRTMITWMAKHPHLVKIIALDIFLCNHDRHSGNLFYHAKTNSFYAIDMDLLFKYSLANLACYNMRKIDASTLTNKEVMALIDLRNILEFLVTAHDPDSMIALFDSLVQEAELTKGSFLCTQWLQFEMGSMRGVIRKNYHDVHNLISILNDLILRTIQEQPLLRGFTEITLFEKRMRLETNLTRM